MTIEFLRSFRIYQMAIFDLVVSYLGIYLLSPLLIKFLKIFRIRTSKSQLMWFTLPLSVIIHMLVGQETALTKMVLNPDGFFVMKFILIGMLAKGLRSK